LRWTASAAPSGITSSVACGQIAAQDSIAVSLIAANGKLWSSWNGAGSSTGAVAWSAARPSRGGT